MLEIWATDEKWGVVMGGRYARDRFFVGNWPLFGDKRVFR